MARKRYTNCSGERVPFDDLNEAEQSYYSKEVQQDATIAGISLEEYCRNFWRGDATEGEPDDG